MNCPFTLSARIARLSLSAKNPETGPVWWYLKPRVQICMVIWTDRKVLNRIKHFFVLL